MNHFPLLHVLGEGKVVGVKYAPIELKWGILEQRVHNLPTFWSKKLNFSKWN
jgi:hypothetical protein